MDIHVEKELRSPVEYELQVTVPAEEVTNRVETALDELAHKVNLPGFRPGHTPRKVIVQKFGNTVTSETISEVLQEAYREALANSELEPVSPGEMSDVQYEPGNPLTFKVTVEVLPEFDLPQLSEVSVELLQPAVEEEDLLSTLDGIRESHAILTPVEEPITRDSVVTIDLQELDKTGVPIVGRVKKDVELDLSRVNLGEDFVKRLVGLTAGQNTVVELDAASGKEGDPKTRYQVTVNNVRRKDLPPLDDEFAKTVNPQMDSMDKLKADLSRYMEARAVHQARERMYRAVADELLHKVDFQVPPRMLDGYMDRLIEDAHRGHREKHTEEEIKKFKEDYRASAVWNLRWFIMRKKIIVDRQLEVTDDEYSAELERLAAMDGKSVADFTKRLTDEQADHVREDLLERKVLAVIHSEVQTIPRPVTLAEFEGRTPSKVVTV